ncbi:helix-turn-helix domain-containing protein [Chryseobacterium sp. 52]|uniref:helix-turn-helix domain-containing protein n=1 Tax=Chryseobacterium sp. 52 TaxID=2035213 RepID=UPI000C18614F|nr:helix-turn-helix domain-containing protein [Chryseobacterium sp. 52]
MKLSQEILFFFSALGVFNGFIISIYLLLFKKPKTATSYFLGLLLFVLSIRIVKSIFLYFYPDLPLIYAQIGLSACFLIGPSLYYFTRSALVQPEKIPVAWKRNYGYWLLVIVIAGIIFPYQNYPGIWKSFVVKLIYVQWAVFVILSGWQLKELFVKLLRSDEKISASERPLISIFIGALVIHIAFVLAFMGWFNGMYISGALFFSFILYLNIPLFISREKNDTVLLVEQEEKRYANKKILDEYALPLAEKLEKIITEQELYKNPDLKLSDLAKKINVSTHQLSQLLNDNLGKNFTAYINEYRIQEACQLIAKDQGIKLEVIGYEVGFNSKSTFYAAFKKHKNTTPNGYKEQLSTV